MLISFLGSLLMINVFLIIFKGRCCRSNLIIHHVVTANPGSREWNGDEWNLYIYIFRTVCVLRVKSLLLFRVHTLSIHWCVNQLVLFLLYLTHELACLRVCILVIVLSLNWKSFLFPLFMDGSLNINVIFRLYGDRACNIMLTKLLITMRNTFKERKLQGPRRSPRQRATWLITVNYISAK